MIFILIFTLLVTLLILVFIPREKTLFIKKFSLLGSSFAFFISTFFWIFFDCSTPKLQFCEDFIWLSYCNINFTLGVDGLSLFFILLTTLLILICLLNSWQLKQNIKEYFIVFLLLEILLLLVFSISDILLFYIFFESVLIPMYLIIGIWGSRERKIRAAYYFFLYTLFGSVIMLLGIIYIFNRVGTTDYEIISFYSFNLLEQKILWLSFFASFASKIPMFPVHLWLPEAHVEAPTSGSVILAGILLKLGVYGFLRFSLPFFPLGSYFFTPLIYTIAILGILYSSFTAIRQLDLKRIIAYSSIAHMNLVVMGIFSFNLVGLEGAIIQSISHGFVSSALFLIIGVFYERYHTRTINYYGGLSHVMPKLIIFFLIFTMANIALPTTSNFIGEFLLLAGIFKLNFSAGFFASLGIILCGLYSLWLFNRISYGNIKILFLEKYSDLTKQEFFTLLPLLIATFILGLQPKMCLSCLNLSVFYLLEFI